MIIGIPKEIKDNENRVSLTPAGASALVQAGHTVLIEKGAGVGSGFSDQEYMVCGAELCATPQEVFDFANMIVKVKEPLPVEYDLFKPGQILFAYLHLASESGLMQALLEKQVVGIAYETVQLPNGRLPILAPMSDVAGRMSVQVGAYFLGKQHGGRGVLLGGVPGVPPAEVVIIGGGAVGTSAAKMAVGMGARVTVLDISSERLSYIDDFFYGGRVTTIMANSFSIAENVMKSDLLISAVLTPGAKAPKVVTESMVRKMKKGSVIVDAAIDQGGSVETMERITTHTDPVFEKYGVIHYSVPNMPGAVAKTSTLALTNITMPYIMAIANKGYAAAVRDDISLLKGVNVAKGKITHELVAKGFDLPYTQLFDLI